MKKLIAIIISASVLFALCACSNTNNSPESETKSTVASSNESTNVGDNSTSNSEKTTKSSVQNQTEPSSSSNPLDNVIVENQDDVTNADGSVNEEIIGTTKPKTSDNLPYATTKQQSFETDIIPIE